MLHAQLKILPITCITCTLSEIDDTGLSHPCFLLDVFCDKGFQPETRFITASTYLKSVVKTSLYVDRLLDTILIYRIRYLEKKPPTGSLGDKA